MATERPGPALRTLPPSGQGAQLRQLLWSNDLEFALEVHDGLSARIVERCGFPCLWVSGLALSTTHGTRDASEVSWSEVIRRVEVIIDSSTVPVLVDGDTGHGDFNIARRFVRKLESLGAAGVCLEDKLYPKENSFLGDDQPLAEIADFSAKITACKEHQLSEDFCVVARTEAFIAGRSLDEAVARAHAYALAGADAVLIHSRASVPDEVVSFATGWEGELPILIAPTTYGKTPPSVFRECGISLVIWSNHTMRAAAAAMRQVAEEIRRLETGMGLETPIVPLSEIFDLLDYEELDRARARHDALGRASARD